MCDTDRHAHTLHAALPVCATDGKVLPTRCRLMMNDIQQVAAAPLDGSSQALDRAAAVVIAHLTHGLSPVTMILAATDWALHLACAPGKQLQLGAKAARKYWRLSDYIGRSLSDPGAAPAIEQIGRAHV